METAAIIVAVVLVVLWSRSQTPEDYNQRREPSGSAYADASVDPHGAAYVAASVLPAGAAAGLARPAYTRVGAPRIDTGRVRAFVAGTMVNG